MKNMRKKLLNSFKAIVLGILLTSTVANGNEFYEPSNKEETINPIFKKYKKHGLDFSERYSLEYSGQKMNPFQNVEKENDYQEYAKLMNQVMQESDIAIQDASDFQERYQKEKVGNKVNPFNDIKKETNYQKFKNTIELFQ